MDIFELSDFEFEELEDFGERNKQNMSAPLSPFSKQLVGLSVLQTNGAITKLSNAIVSIRLTVPSRGESSKFQIGTTSAPSHISLYCNCFLGLPPSARKVPMESTI